MKKLLSVFLVVVMIVTALPLTTFNLSASAEVDGYYYYEVNNGEATVTGVSSSISGDITIPSTLGGYTVTSIGEYAFEYCSSLTSFTIPDSVLNIGSRAFYGTAYYNNRNNWENNVLYIGNYLIKAKTNISGAYEIKSGTKAIADEAFYECSSLTSVTIPDSVLNIGDEAFYYCDSLTSVTIGDSVTSIGSRAFYGTAYYNNSNNWENNVLYIGNYLIEAKSNISGAYEIKSGTKVIADSAFSNCSSLTSVTIPDSVLNIGDEAFYYCDSLTSVTIPNSVLNIGDRAFDDCDSLISVKIGDSVTSIGNSAFAGCSSLTSVTIGDSVTSIGEWAFYECYSLTSVIIPDSVISICEGAFRYCNSLTSVTIGESVLNIGDSAFSDCYSLTSVTIPDNVTSIGDSAFYRCESLTSITIPDSVTSIGNRAFSYCYSLTSVTIPDSVTSIGDWAFSECYYLTIYGYSGSAAEDYALENEIKFVSLGCSHKNTTVHPAKASTCKVQGNNKYTTCNDCGNVISGSDAKLPLAGHKYTTKTTKATLTKNGSIVKKCSVCGKVASTTTIYYPKTVSIAATTYTYTGKVITPAITVKGSNGKVLKNGTDYTVTYGTGRKNVGKYKVTVTFKGNYSGTKTFYFTINPVKTTLSKLTAGSKSIKVNITKKSTQVTGYQIQYSTSKTFKSAKIATVKNYKTTSTTLTKLTAKKTYYVRVRTYKTVGKTNYYSSWSTYKYTKTK